MRDDRPWGYFEILAFGSGWQVKRLVVNSKHRLSLQTHQHRSEVWIGIAGEGLATVGQQEKFMGTATILHIGIGMPHRLENKSEDPLEVIEIQLGKILAESDEIMLEDDYGRVK